MTAATLPAILTIAYDVSSPAGLEVARRHRSWWGILYTDVSLLNDDTAILEFRPSPQLWWREWEAVRLGWIFEDLERTEAAA
jgi:hypothetical protein